MKRRVVVTGLGSVTSLACQVDELWKRLLNGESGVHPLRIIEGIDRFKVRFGGDVYDWQPENWPAAFIAKPDGFTEKKEIKRLDRFSQLAMVSAYQAVTASAGGFAKDAGFRRGVQLRHGIDCLHEIEA